MGLVHTLKNLFNQDAEKKKQEIYFGIRLNISVQFPRPLSYPQLEHLGRYLTDVTRGNFSLVAGHYEKTFSSPTLPLLSHEPKRFHTNTRSEGFTGIIKSNERADDLIFDIHEEMSEQRVVFTGIEFILDNPDFQPLTEKQNELLTLVKDSIPEYFQTYKK